MSEEQNRWQPNPAETSIGLFAFPVVHQHNSSHSKFDRALALAPAHQDLSDTNALVRPEIGAVINLVRSIIPESTTDPVGLSTSPPLPESFDGRSFMLAYFLAAIACYRSLRPWSERSTHWGGPIWATGEIEDSGIVAPVRDEDFDAKMIGFLDAKEPARLFIVPSANWSSYESRHPIRSDGPYVLSLSEPGILGALESKATLSAKKLVLHVPTSMTGSQVALLALVETVFARESYANGDLLRLAINSWFMALLPVRAMLVALEVCAYVSFATMLRHTTRPFGDMTWLVLAAVVGGVWWTAIAIPMSVVSAYVSVKLKHWRHPQFGLWAAILWIGYLPQAHGPLGLGLLASTMVLLGSMALTTTAFMFRASLLLKVSVAVIAAMAATWMSRAATGAIDIGRMTGRQPTSRAYALYSKFTVLLPTIAVAPFVLVPWETGLAWPVLLAVLLTTIRATSSSQTARGLFVRLFLFCYLAAGLPVGMSLSTLLVKLPHVSPPTWEVGALHLWPLNPAVLVLVGTILSVTRYSSGRALRRITELAEGLRRIDEYRRGVVQQLADSSTFELLRAGVLGRADALAAKGSVPSRAGAAPGERATTPLIDQLRDTGAAAVRLSKQSIQLYQKGDLDGAETACRDAEELYSRIDDFGGAAICLSDRATIRLARGDLDAAIALGIRADEQIRKLGPGKALEMLRRQGLALKSSDTDAPVMRMLEQQTSIWRRAGDKARLLRYIVGHGMVCYVAGDLDGALRRYWEEECICWEIGDKKGAAISVGRQADAYAESGDLQAALALYRRQEQLYRELDQPDGVATALGHQASIAVRRREPGDAFRLYREQEILCRSTGNLDELLTSLMGQSILARANHDTGLADALLGECERIHRDRNDPDGLQACLGERVEVARQRGDPAAALVLLGERERLCRELGQRQRLRDVLRQRAEIIGESGDLSAAAALHAEEVRLCRELGDEVGLKMALASQAYLLGQNGELKEALVLEQEREAIGRRCGDLPTLGASLGAQAILTRSLGDFDGAQSLLEAQERICQELNDMAGCREVLYAKACLLQEREELDAATAVLQEYEGKCREAGNGDGIARALVSRSEILLQQDRKGEAAPLLREAERISQECGNKRVLALALFLTIQILRDEGELAVALKHVREAKSIARQFGTRSMLCGWLECEAEILRDLGALAEALRVAEEATRLRRQTADNRELAVSLLLQASVLRRMNGRGTDANTVVNEARQVAARVGAREILEELDAHLDE